MSKTKCRQNANFQISIYSLLVAFMGIHNILQYGYSSSRGTSVITVSRSHGFTQTQMLKNTTGTIISSGILPVDIIK